MHPRERLLAIVTGVLVGGWALNAAVIAPVGAWLGQVAAETRAAEQQANEAKALIDRQARILADWRGRHAAGLLDDEAAARFKTQQAIAGSARASGFVIDSVGGGQLVTAARGEV